MDLIRIEQIEQINVVDSRLIALELDIQHKNFVATINKYKAEIEKDFGALAFQADGLQGTRNYAEYYYLTEDQATYLMTLSKNTDKVRDCKRKLVKSFSQAKQIIVKQQENMQELTLKLALANAEKDKFVAEKKLLDTRHLIATTCPEPLQQKILGYQVIKEVERVEVVIDKQSNREYDGVGITYIAKTLGFKTTAQCWAWLERNGYGKDSGKWRNELAAVTSQKLSLDDLEYLKYALKNQPSQRQLFIGE